MNRRVFLLAIGWSSMLGSFVDGALAIYALWAVLISEGATASLTVDAFLKDYAASVYWVKQFAFYVLPDGAVNWLFAVPALLYFPFRVLMSIVIGRWALTKAAHYRR